MCNHYHPLSLDDHEHGPADAAFSRRGFMQGSLAALATTATVPAFFAQAGNALADTSMRLSSKPGSAEDRVLVVIQLSGGNDGLNTVVPVGSDDYHRARQNLGISPEDALHLEGHRGFALHPAMGPIHEMFAAGTAAAVHGVGYPNPNRSHFKSMDIWHTGVRQAEGGDRGKGWIGKALDHAMGGDHPDAGLACISLGNESYIATQGKQVNAVSFDRADQFRWLGQGMDDQLDQTYTETRQADDAGSGRFDPSDPTAFLQRTAFDAEVASQRVRRAVQGKHKVKWPGGGLANRLKAVANMIKAELPTRVYYVSTGGFDTHANQPYRHNTLMRDFSRAVRAFQDELEATGHDGRVLTFAFSEFGRRVKENASRGTDHGVAGPVFLFGQPVKPGLHGKHPSLTQLNQGDLVHTTDFRGVYTDILENWMKMDAVPAVGGRYKSPGLIQRTA